MRIPWRHLGFAAVGIAAAAGVRYMLDPVLGTGVPYAFFMVAVLLTAWRTSTPVAIAAAVAGWAIADYLFVEPRFTAFVSGWLNSTAYFTISGTIVFIADRMRRALVRAERSEHQLELISRRLPALISYVDADRRYSWCNDEYTKWFGLAREQVIGHTVEEVLGEDAYRAVSGRIDTAFSGQFVEYESEVPYEHGGRRWIHVTYTPHRDDDGAVQGIIVMVTDISERRRADDDASLLAEVSQAFALNVTAEAAARQVTARLVDRLGLSRCLLAEVEGDLVRVFHQQSSEPEPSQAGDYRAGDFLSEAELRLLAEGKPLVINDVREGRSAAAAARYRALGTGAVVSAPYVADGKRKFALAAEKREPYAWKEAEVELLCEVAARIYVQLDRARAEQTLRASELRYRSLVSVITDIPCTVDPIGRFVTRQDAWSRYTGQSFEKYRDYGWFDAVHPDDRGRARVAWIGSMHARGPYEVRLRLWHAATREFRHVIARATPLLDVTGTVREWVGACTDIHDETRQAEALVEADRRKDEFLATLAHELRNPLAPIRNSLHILKLTGKVEGAVGKVHEMLERQVKHLVRLVDDLLEVSRITRGRVELRKERMDLQSIVQSAIETSQPLLDEAGHRLDVGLPQVPIEVEVDPVRIAQVITNLLNNAAKFTDRGGRIEVSARREGGNAVVTVRDNGRGIGAEVLPRIFDLFTQAQAGRDRGHGGLGIGLTLARSLVELHGGTIEARSEGSKRGSEFIVTLPLRGTAGDAAAAPPPPGSAVTVRRVLVVDDNQDAADSLGMLLTLQGIETATAHDGRAALEKLDAFRPSIILLDLAMPGMDGYEVAQRVRQHPHGRHVTIVALTGWGQDRDRRRSELVGIRHHLVKPVDLDVLRELLASLAAEAA